MSMGRMWSLSVTRKTSSRHGYQGRMVAVAIAQAAEFLEEDDIG